MVVPFLVCLVALIAVLIALYGGDQPDGRPRGEDQHRPDKLPVPDPDEERPPQ